MLTNPTTAAPAASSQRSRRRGGFRRNILASLPDPVEQERAAAEGYERAKAAIVAAEAAGSPLMTQAGTRRSPVTLPEYRRGRSPANKGRRYPPELLSAQEVEAIMAALPTVGRSGPRDRALVALLWRGGLRISEALALDPKDLDLAAPAVTVLRGKGAKRRLAAIDAGTASCLRAWLQVRDTLELPDDAPLFCTVRNDAGGPGRPVQDSSVREMLKCYARKAGISKRVHPHGLRHTHANELSLENVPVHVIQKQLGHGSLDMTQHYLDHLHPKDLVRIIGERTWPGHQPPPQPTTTAALSQEKPAPVSDASAVPVRRIAGEPGEPPRRQHASKARAGAGGDRVLAVLHANGGQATQAQIARALGIRPSTVIKHIHALQERGAIQRAGIDRHRSVIWRVAPPAVHVRRITARRHHRAPDGQGAPRILDALEALGGRASQAQIARLLSLSPQTVQGYCHQLEADGLINRGGLDKSTSNRGSRVWRLKGPSADFAPAGGGMQIRLPLGTHSTASNYTG